MANEENNNIVTDDLYSFDDYSFNLMNGNNTSGSPLSTFTSYFQGIGAYSTGYNQETSSTTLKSVSYDKMRTEWISYGNTFSTELKKYNYLNNTSGIGDIFSNTIANGEFWKDTGSNALLILKAGATAVGLAASQTANILANAVSGIDSALASVEGKIADFYGASINYSEMLADTLDGIASSVGQDSVFMSAIGRGISIFSSGGLRKYRNGVDETSFGLLMESSWSKGGNSFYKLKEKGTIKVALSTPFDAGSNLTSLYGNMLLGVPPIFNNIVDPKNRAIAQTIIRDAKFLTLTPGFPKYNGSALLQTASDDMYHQTKTPEAMLAYLTKNGLDESFANKDRRYYTFKTDYEEYYSYLETMLNTLWIKMGLSSNGSTEHTIFTFFTDLTSGQLKPQYKTSFGFYVNPTGALTEAISNIQTNFGASNKSEVDSASEMYQQINYITGMGTGGAVRDSAAMAAKTMGLIRNTTEWVKDIASNVIDVWQSDRSLVKKAIFSIPAAIKDTQRFLTEKDQGVSFQAFATTNGMKVQYPELWSDSTYSRGININFEFISPYGDPMSIFQYVLAPFAALFCYACPRQASDNGYVSPFFVRADIPGYFTSDLSIISDFTFTRGGTNDLWTKDGLPRAISGSFTILDLYPYLAMTKRLSFLSANPNYTVFLDSLTGLHAINTGESTDALNEYWKKMLGRVNGLNSDRTLWNRYSVGSSLMHIKHTESEKPNRIGGNTKNAVTTTWLRGIK